MNEIVSNFIKKLQNKPEQEKKIILWSIIIIVGAIFIFLWLYISNKRIGEFKNSDFMGGISLPIKEELPSIKIPESMKEDFNKFEETVKNLENGQKE